MRYWRIANSDGKVWLLPRRNTRVALELYQPSWWKGKVLKAVLPLFSALPEICAPFPLLDWTVEDELQEVLSGIFPEKRLEWAVFEGTPSIHQKLVLQVFCGQEILAYCKISGKDDVKRLFAQEAELLQNLREKGIVSIPRCLYLGPIGEDRQMMVLSTEKTIHSRVPHEWCGLHQSFLAELQAKTSQMIAFEECDLAQGIKLLKERTDVLPPCMDRDSLMRAIELVESNCQGKEIECAVSHGDFTPWNMLVEKDRLFVFDWEYAFHHCPVGFDRYHFFSQTAFFERHWTAEEFMSYTATPEGAWIDIDQLIYYLLMILSRFVGREPAGKKMTDTTLFAFWNQLIILCLKTK